MAVVSSLLMRTVLRPRIIVFCVLTFMGRCVFKMSTTPLHLHKFVAGFVTSRGLSVIGEFIIR